MQRGLNGHSSIVKKVITFLMEIDVVVKVPMRVGIFAFSPVFLKFALAIQ
jgi:hypothetical protein